MANILPTPTPWHVSVEENSRRDDVYIVGNPTGAIGGARKLAYMVDTWTGANTEANAAFIVKACNSHEQLVAALQVFAHFADALDERVPDNIALAIFADGAVRFGPSGGGTIGDLRKARAALAAAGAA